MTTLTFVEKRRRARLALLSFSTILCSGLAAPALAQTAPAYRNLDANGVDLTTDDFVMAFTEGSIGSGQSELALIRQNNGNYPSQWDGYTFNRTVSGTTATFTVGQAGRYGDTFTGPKTGTSWTPSKGNGATLTASGGGYSYQAPDGTVVTFIDPTDPDQGYSNFCNTLPPDQTACSMLPSTIMSPDGAKVTLNYQLYYYPGTVYSGHVNNIYVPRLKTVSNNFGYQITFGYSTALPGHGSTPPAASYYQRLSAKFYNNTVSTTTPQGTVSYTYPSAGVTDITDMAGNVWEVTATSIKRPGESSPSFSIGGTAGAVTSATRDGVTTGYAYTVSGTTATMVVTDALSNHATIVSDLSIDRPKTVTDANSKTVTNTYDASGRLTRIPSRKAIMSITHSTVAAMPRRSRSVERPAAKHPR